jgi:nucleotide-binding universal stress UspA family protein
VVVGIDFSQGAATAVVEARRLAGRLGVEPALVHVVEDGLAAPSPEAIRSWLTEHDLSPCTVELARGTAWIEPAGWRWPPPPGWWWWEVTDGPAFSR